MGHENRVSCLGVSNDGISLCTGSWDAFVRTTTPPSCPLAQLITDNLIAQGVGLLATPLIPIRSALLDTRTRCAAREKTIKCTFFVP